MKIKLLLAASSLILSSAANAALVAWYPLDTDALDASGNGHNGAVAGSGVTFGQAGANGNTGQSTDFAGTGNINVPFSSSLNPASFTVTLWANPDVVTGGHQSPLTSRDDVGGGTPSTNGYIIYREPDGNWHFWTGDGVPAWDNDAGPAAAISTWVHLAITYQSPADGGGATGTKKLFVDGNLEFTDTTPNGGVTQYSPNGPEAEDLHIGGGGDDGTEFRFNGRIDDVTIWDEVLTQTQIQDIAANSIPEPGAFSLLGLAGLGLMLRRRR